jgi:sugar lactone lactonase YvrE
MSLGKKVFAGLVILFVLVGVWHHLMWPPRQTHEFVRRFSDLPFDNLAICEHHKYLLGINQARGSATVLNLETGEKIAELSSAAQPLNKPFGIACDDEHQRILVSDTGNKQIKIFDIGKFSLNQVVDESESYATIAFDQKSNRLFAIVLSQTDAPPGQKIRVLSGETLQPVGDPLVLAIKQGDEHERIMFANDLAIDTNGNRLIVADYGNARFDLFSLQDLTGGPLMGVATGFYDIGWRNVVPNKPTGITADSAGHIIVADDAATHRIQVFKIGPSSPKSIINAHLIEPNKIVAFGDELFVTDKSSAFADRHVDLYKIVY